VSALAQLDAALEGPVAAALEAIARHPAPAVVVSDEIGLGMVPMDPGARAFRDLQGLVHPRLADAADEVPLMVAGLPLTLKPRSRPGRSGSSAMRPRSGPASA